MLTFLGGAFATFWIFLNVSPKRAEAWMNLFIPKPMDFIANERLRWAGLSFLSLALILAFGLALRISRRWGRIGGPLLLVPARGLAALVAAAALSDGPRCCPI